VTQSPEYPDLRWMPPASWTNANRSSVQLIVIHTTEGTARATAAEDGASYDQRRTDGTSTHYFHDSNSTIQCVRTEDQAHAARAQGNRRGVQHELCTKAGSAPWADDYHQAMLRQAARQAARDAKKWGIPVRHLTVQQVANGDKGFCGHRDITLAFPQDHGTHTDPGANFPWTQFLSLVRAESAPPAPAEEDDMPTAEEIATAVWNFQVENPYITSGNKMQPAQTPLRYAPSRTPHEQTQAKVDALSAQFAAFTLAETLDDERKQEALEAIREAVDSAAASAAATVIAALPAGVDISQEMVTTAMTQALATLFSAEQ
jgi:N-acetyl-anhydromuramyl-L-alanine amidase AmpD